MAAHVLHVRCMRVHLFSAAPEAPPDISDFTLIHLILG